MKNKNLNGIMVIFLLLILMNLMPTINAEPTVMVTSFNLYPEVLMPGDDAELTITLTNTEVTATHTDTDYINSLPVDVMVDTISATIENVWITSDGDGSYSITAHDNYEDIGDLSPGSSISLSFKISVDENISQGLYYPIIRVDIEDYQDVKYPFPVRIDNKSLSIMSSDVPSKISVGGSTDISFNVINKRKNGVEGISIYSVGDSDLEFNPNAVFIGSLDSGNSEEVVVSLNPTDLGNKILSLNLSFLNGDNAHFEIINIPIEVGEVLDVAPIFTNIPISIKKGSSSRIGLEVYNAKTESITGVIITPITNATVIPSQYFIGAMDSDDVFSASFDLYTDMLDYGNNTIKFKVSYKQGSEYYETPTIDHSFRVISGEGTSYLPSTKDSDESNGFSGDILSMCIPILLLIIVIVIIIVLWKWKKGRKNQ